MPAFDGGICNTCYWWDIKNWQQHDFHFGAQKTQAQRARCFLHAPTTMPFTYDSDWCPEHMLRHEQCKACHDIPKWRAFWCFQQMGDGCRDQLSKQTLRAKSSLYPFQRVEDGTIIQVSLDNKHWVVVPDKEKEG